MLSDTMFLVFKAVTQSGETSPLFRTEVQALEWLAPRLWERAKRFDAKGVQVQEFDPVGFGEISREVVTFPFDICGRTLQDKYDLFGGDGKPVIDLRRATTDAKPGEVQRKTKYYPMRDNDRARFWLTTDENLAAKPPGLAQKIGDAARAAVSAAAGLVAPAKVAVAK